MAVRGLSHRDFSACGRAFATRRYGDLCCYYWGWEAPERCSSNALPKRRRPAAAMPVCCNKWLARLSSYEPFCRLGWQRTCRYPWSRCARRRSRGFAVMRRRYNYGEAIRCEDSAMPWRVWSSVPLWRCSFRCGRIRRTSRRRLQWHYVADSTGSRTVLQRWSLHSCALRRSIQYSQPCICSVCCR